MWNIDMCLAIFSPKFDKFDAFLNIKNFSQIQTQFKIPAKIECLKTYHEIAWIWIGQK